MRRDDSLGRILCAGLLLAAATAQAGRYERDSFRDVRWLGRGNTGVAIVDDGSSVFYNPAGLAHNDAYIFPLFNPWFGANTNFASSFSQLTTLYQGSSTLSEKFAPFLGKPLALQGAIMPHVAVPYFTAGYYAYGDTSLVYRNPVYPRLDIDVRYDYGPFVGGGLNVQDKLFLGASIRYIRRTAIDEQITADTLLANSASLLKNLTHKGEGWGFNIGAQFRQKINDMNAIAFGVTVEDAGYTRFKNSDRTVPPATQVQQVNFGTAYEVKALGLSSTLLFDIRQYTNNEMSFTKKVHFGAEFNFYIATVRGGYFQGNWCGGLTFSALPFLNFDFTTYAEEIDSAAGLRNNRYYILGMRMGIDLKPGQSGRKKKSRFDLSKY